MNKIGPRKLGSLVAIGVCIATLVLCFAGIAGCQNGSSNDHQNKQQEQTKTDQQATQQASASRDQAKQPTDQGQNITDETSFVPSAEATNYVDITMDSDKHIVIELKPGVAPKTVENFQKLVKNHFYDGLTFHRVIDGFMIQGGDPQGNGTGGSGENILGEFKKNGVQNPLSHKRGVVSMARSQQYNSASSQFFICNGDATFLDGEYAAFGVVVRGMDEVDRIAKLPKDGNDKPNTPPVMKTVTFVTPEK